MEIFEVTYQLLPAGQIKSTSKKKYTVLVEANNILAVYAKAIQLGNRKHPNHGIKIINTKIVKA